MIRDKCLKSISSLALAMAVVAGAHAATTDISTVPLNTYSAPSSTDVKPNVMFILDDSGSMDWDFMPDWACASYSTQNSGCNNTGQDPASARSEYLFRNSSYNGVYYNPAVYYKPPVAVDSSGVANTTTYPSMRGVSTATGGNSSASSGSPNWKAVKNDAYGVQVIPSGTWTPGPTTSDLSTANPYFFTTVPGEYCTSSSLKTCTTASAPSASYPFPAPLRWCNSSSLSTCQAAFSGTFNYARSPAARTATIVVSGTSSTSVSGITVNSLQVMSGTASATTSSSTMASNIAAQINACTTTQAGNCQVVGYSASNNNSTVTITAPGAISYTPSVTKGNSGTMTLTASAFSAGTIPGDILRTTIAPTVTSYPYPGSSAKALARTDCVGSTCTYAEEMTNYANWWTYYRTRMQMMKTAASNAFSTIDSAADLSNNVSRFRLGYMTINNNTNSDFLNLGEFSNSQKYNWYTKLISANPGNSTPLRATLSDAGRLYAGKLNGSTYNGVTVVDPLQYSCQQNYTILSTDGFWNESSGFNKLDGSTAVGNQDAALPRPYYDGGSAQIQTRTSTLQSQTVTPQWQMSTSQLQLQTTTLQAQAQTSQLQLQTTTLQAQAQTNQLQLQTTTLQVQAQTNQLQLQTTTLQAQTQTNTLQKQVSQLQATTVHLQSSTKISGNNYTTPVDVASCTYGNNTRCSYGTPTITGVASCPTIGTKTSGTGNGTVYNGPTVTTACSPVVTAAYATATSCTTTTTPDANGFTTQCNYAGWTNSGSPGAASTCNAAAIAPSTGPSYTVGVARQCVPTASLLSGYSSASTCTATTTPDANGRTTQCQYAGWTNSGSPGAASTCNATAIAPSTGPSYTVGVARQCVPTASLLSGYSSASTCTATTTPDANGTTTQCQYAGWTNSGSPGAASTCNAAAVAPSTGPSYTVGVARQCIPTASLLSGYANASACTTTTTPDANGQTTQCQYASWTNSGSPAAATACSALAQSTGPVYSVGLATRCNATASLLSGYANASACTTTTTPDANGQTTQCRYSSWSSATTVTACTATAQSTASPYTVGVATTCTSIAPALGTWTAATTCTASSTSNCQYTAWTAWANATSCTTVTQSASPNYAVATARDCQVTTSGGTSNTLADVAAYYYNTDLRSPIAINGMSTGTCTGPTIAPATTPNDLCADNVPANGRDVATTQHMTTFTLGLGSQGQMIYAPTDGKDYWNDTSGDFFDVKAGTTANTSTGICSWQSSGACNWPTPSSNSNANIDDLWHAAINGHGTYFSAKDPATLASGLTNTLAAIANVPRPGTAAAAASSNPNVSASDNYIFSSSYKSVEWYGELVRQQITTTGTLTGQNWSAMRLLDCATTPWTASTSYVLGANYRQGTTCYTVTSSYTSGSSFDSSAAGLDMSNTDVVHVDEAAPPASQVAATALTSRTIYTKRVTSLGAPALISFTWGALAASQQAYFTAPAITYASATVGLSQFCTSGGNCLSSTAQSNTTLATGGAAGEALVNFLRGDRSQEGGYYRTRTHVLGDIVASEARYVKAPLFNYSDASYTAYKALVSSRNGTVYVGANDGMLHAFDATSGQETWAYVPEIVLPSLYKLADKNYSTQHQFFVDDTPEVGDICPNAPSSSCAASEWKTILVGGLNRGGKGYYALDITDPTTPKLLWEFTDTNLGYSYGNPRITKLKNGTWVVLLSSGYNNADGQGRVYVLNANSGTLIRSISDGTGTAGSPSGLARLGAHALTPDTDNTTLAAYGGDTLGNLWRFDVNGDIGASGYDAQLLATFKDAGGNAQPITAKPTIASVNGKPIVYVGTGRYLGTSDVTDTSTQSFYAVLDKSDTTSLGNPRTTGSGFVQQTLTNGTCPSGSSVSVCSPGQVVRTSSSNAVDWTTSNGWYIDFLTGGERASTDPTLGLGSLLFTTIRPQSSSVSACGAPGTDTSASFLYVLNYLTGGAVVGANTVTGVSLGSGLVTRPVMIELTDGSVRALIRASTGGSAGSVSSGSTATDLGNTLVVTPTVNLSSSGNLRRVSWRELTSR